MARNVGTAVGVSAVDTTVQELTFSGGNALGPLVRLNLDGTNGTEVVISAYLTPKRT
jgi:hypothetical protein